MALYIESLYSRIQEISDIISKYVDTLENPKENIVGDSSALPAEEGRALVGKGIEVCRYLGITKPNPNTQVDWVFPVSLQRLIGSDTFTN